jgi:hypothetical protein
MLLSRDLGELRDLRSVSAVMSLRPFGVSSRRLVNGLCWHSPSRSASAHMVRATRVVLRDQALASLFASGRVTPASFSLPMLSTICWHA